jgi:hypothetical protein
VSSLPTPSIAVSRVFQNSGEILDLLDIQRLTPFPAFLKARAALWPPKPNDADMARSNSAFLAVIRHIIEIAFRVGLG